MKQKYRSSASLTSNRDISGTSLSPASSRHVTSLLLFLVALVAAGCMSPRAYLDPQYRRAQLTDITSTDNPKPVILDVAFQVNGKDKPSVDAFVRGKVLKVLRSTKVFAECTTGPQASISHLKILVNNLGDIGAAAGKGVALGLTGGLAGAEVADNYEMTVVYTQTDGNSITKTYKHAMHTVFGAHSAPAGMEQVPRELAFGQIMEDMLLNFLSDLQKEAKL
jgi:hypothetical protein